MVKALEVPIPGPNDGFRYGETHAQQIAESIHQLDITYRTWDAIDVVPTYTEDDKLGSGRGSTVYQDGDIAIRVPKNPADVATYAHDLIRGIGVPCFEQVLAKSDTKLYSEVVCGVSRNRVRSRMMEHFETSTIEMLLDGMTMAQARGLAIDTIGDNVLLDGFGIGIVDAEIDPTQPIERKLGHVATVLGTGGLRVIERQQGEAAMRQEAAGRIEPIKMLRSAVLRRAHIAPQFWLPVMPAMDNALLRAEQLAKQ
jgi:hypothetical protein